TAEFRIPLSQLRYADAPSHTFGFGVWRDIERYKERVSWPEYQPSKSGLSSQLGQLSGIAGIVSARTLEVTPYAVAKNGTRSNAIGYTRAQRETAGADLKLGIPPNETLRDNREPDLGQTASNTTLRQRD